MKSGLSGSTPSREAKYSAQGVAAQQHVAGAEAAHVDEQQVLAAAQRAAELKRTRRWPVLLVLGGGTSSRLPVMRRCITRCTSSSSRHDQVLAAPAQRLDQPPVQRVGDGLGRRRLAPARVEHLRVLEPAALECGRQLAADGLDLGELRHRPDLGTSGRG